MPSLDDVYDALELTDAERRNFESLGVITLQDLIVLVPQDVQTAVPRLLPCRRLQFVLEHWRSQGFSATAKTPISVDNILAARYERARTAEKTLLVVTWIQYLAIILCTNVFLLLVLRR